MTVDERNVIPGDSHRRGGLHTEAPGTTLTVTGAASVDEISIDPDSGQTYPPRFHGWGIGMIMQNRSYRGGIFMASTVDDSCAVYNARVRRPEVDSSGFMKKGDTTAVGLLGDCEHLRPCAQHTRRLMKANELVWMTDTTLHESLPLKVRVTSLHVCVCWSVCLSVCVCLCLSVSACLCLCLYLYFCAYACASVWCWCLLF